MSTLMLLPLFESLWETIYMVYVSSLIAIVCGLVLGIILYITAKDRLIPNKAVHQILGFIVNATRSIPYIILMIILIPITRLIVGTSIGTNAAIVPLALAAIPFYARISEVAISEVPIGLVEAAKSMGASPWQTIYKVLIPEAMPSLISGATLTIISLIGYSAMAGAVGGGGLGDLAYRFGYERFNLIVLTETVVVLILMVQIIQWYGDYLAKARSLKTLALLTIALLVASIGGQVYQNTPQVNQLKIGVMSGPDVEIWSLAKKVAKDEYGLNVKLIEFSDYALPNAALNAGDIDANLFQTVPYLESQMKTRGYKLAVMAKTFIFPMGIYSKRVKTLSDLKKGALVVIPNDPSNGGRALLLMAKAGLIQLKLGVDLFPSTQDIIENKLALKIKPINAAQMPHVVKDVSLLLLNNNYVRPAGFVPSDALYREDKSAPYENIMAVRAKDRTRSDLKQFVKAIHDQAVVKKAQVLFPGGEALPAW